MLKFRENDIRILYARLLKLGIDDYLITEEFDYFCIEYNLHELWGHCEDIINSQSSVAVLVPGYTGTAKEAFGIFLQQLNSQTSSVEFRQIIKALLLDFNEWKKGSIDFSSIKEILLNLGFEIEDLNQINAHKEKVSKNIGPISSTVLGISKQKDPMKKTESSKKIFIVHGHDLGVRERVARFLSSLDLEPIILDEKPSGGKSIIEKIEANDDVSYAIVILTPDDEGKSKMETSYKTRARQNVILELGYFMGKLGRQKVCALYVDVEELPSDYSGIVYVLFDKADRWKLKLAKELKETGIKIDMNNL